MNKSTKPNDLSYQWLTDKTRSKPFLKFYNKHIEKGIIPDGLCFCIYSEFNLEDLYTKLQMPNDEFVYLRNLLSLFKPTMENEWEYKIDNGLYWGDDENEKTEAKKHVKRVLNEFRQNIILFCAAINDEL